MARTNAPAARAPRIQTHEATPAKRLTDVQALRRALLSCLLWEDQFYEDGEEIAERLKRLTLAVPPSDAAALAIEAREQGKLRHAPLWIARHLAGGTLAQRAVVADLLGRIIQRPDELTEFLALYWKGNRVPLSAQVKKGLAKAFPKFSAYQLAKYDRAEAIKLRDVLFLSHAKPRDADQAATWKQLVERTLPIPDTWEVALSAGADKRATWERLLTEQKLGALALLRNLRNMLGVQVPEAAIRTALQNMQVERVLPFRFIAAAKYAPTLESDLEQAMFRCLASHEKLTGRTALVVDTSPSMWQARISGKSELDRFEAAAALAILCREICESVRVYAFNEKAYDVPARQGFALRDALAQTKGGYSRGGLAVAKANADGYDRIIVLTDGQWHYPTGESGADAVAVSPAPLTERAYLLNVAAYRNAIGSSKWVMIDGWSEALIDYIAATEHTATPPASPA